MLRRNGLELIFELIAQDFILTFILLLFHKFRLINCIVIFLEELTALLHLLKLIMISLGCLLYLYIRLSVSILLSMGPVTHIILHEVLILWLFYNTSVCSPEVIEIFWTYFIIIACSNTFFIFFFDMILRIQRIRSLLSKKRLSLDFLLFFN